MVLKCVYLGVFAVLCLGMVLKRMYLGVFVVVFLGMVLTCVFGCVCGDVSWYGPEKGESVLVLIVKMCCLFCL